jgi:hypothetical protein
MYATTTDFLTTGDLHVMGYDGVVLNTVAVGVAPGRLALDLRSTSGIGEANEVKGSVFPNPAIEIISIRLPQKGAFIIVDATGRAVRADRAATGLSTASVNVESLSTGLYSVLQNGSLVARFTKQ